MRGDQWEATNSIGAPLGWLVGWVGFRAPPSSDCGLHWVGYTHRSQDNQSILDPISVADDSFVYGNWLGLRFKLPREHPFGCHGLRFKFPREHPLDAMRALRLPREHDGHGIGVR